MGGEAVLTLIVRNLGSVEASNFAVSTWFHYGATPTCGAVGSVTENIPNLSAGASVTLVYPFNFPSLLGNYTAWTVVDSACTVVEVSEANNLANRAYTVAGPDIAVTDVTVLPPHGLPGTSATLAVTVRNLGSVTLKNVVLASWFNSNATPVCGSTGSVTQGIETISAGEILTFEYPFALPTAFGNYTARAFVDVTCLFTESNESNNHFSRAYSVTGPDLSVVSVSITPSVVAPPGTEAVMTVTIKNLGSQTANTSVCRVGFLWAARLLAELWAVSRRILQSWRRNKWRSSNIRSPSPAH